LESSCIILEKGARVIFLLKFCGRFWNIFREQLFGILLNTKQQKETEVTEDGEGDRGQGTGDRGRGTKNKQKDRGGGEEGEEEGEEGEAGEEWEGKRNLDD
jgi:hypothetical protein